MILLKLILGAVILWFTVFGIFLIYKKLTTNPQLTKENKMLNFIKRIFVAFREFFNALSMDPNEGPADDGFASPENDTEKKEYPVADPNKPLTIEEIRNFDVKSNPKEILERLKNEFAKRTEKYEEDSQEVFKSKEKIASKINDYKVKIADSEEKANLILGCDVQGNRKTIYDEKTGNVIKPRPGYRWVPNPKHNQKGFLNGGCSTEPRYIEEEITEKDLNDARCMNELANGYKLAMETMIPAYNEIVAQADLCYNNITQMKFMEQMYGTKIECLEAQINAANAVSSMVNIATFDIDSDSLVNEIQNKINEITWDAKAKMTVANAKRDQQNGESVANRLISNSSNFEDKISKIMHPSLPKTEVKVEKEELKTETWDNKMNKSFMNKSVEKEIKGEV